MSGAGWGAGSGACTGELGGRGTRCAVIGESAGGCSWLGVTGPLATGGAGRTYWSGATACNVGVTGCPSFVSTVGGGI